jgi:hypothetical protein
MLEPSELTLDRPTGTVELAGALRLARASSTFYRPQTGNPDYGLMTSRVLRLTITLPLGNVTSASTL